MILSFVAALGGILFGYDTVVISGTIAVVEVCYNTAQDELAEQTIFHRNEVHSSTVSRIVAYKAKGAELSGLGHAQVEDSTPFVDNKIALFFGVVNWESSPWWKFW